MRSLHEFLRLGHTPLDCRNQDLSGFFTSIDKDRFLAAWRLLLTWYATTFHHHAPHCGHPSYFHHPTSGPRSFEGTLLLRYVDNRLAVATPRWFSTPAAHILCDEHFYGGDIILETEAALDFLGFRLDLECGTISFIPSYEKHNMLSIKSAAPMMHKESGYYSRRALISRVSFPEFQRDHDLALLTKLYHQHGFTLQKEEKTYRPSFATI